jgi:uncharacterized membrane protein
MKLFSKDLQFWIKALTLAIIVAILFKSPINDSFWLDETLTIWTNTGTISELFSRVIEVQGQSPLYFLLVRPLTRVSNPEFFLKGISALITLIYSWVFYSLLRKWFTFEIAIFGAALAATTDTLLVAAFSARPYSLAMLTALGATWALINWLEETKRFNQIISWLGLMVVTFYLHYLFALLAVPHLALIISRWRGLNKKDLKIITGAVIIGVILSIPGFYQVASLSSRSSSLSFAQIPGAIDFIRTIIPPSVLLFTTTAFLVAGFFARFDFGLKRPEWTSKGVLPTLIGWLFAPCLFFAHAHISGSSMFLDRWFMWIVPALIVLVCGAISLIGNHRTLQIFVTVGLGLMLTRELDRKWQVEDWRLAAQEVSAQKDLKVVSYSGLIELENPQFLSDKTKADYLSAPLLNYGVKNLIIPVGINPHSTSMQEYYLKNLYPEISTEGSFIFVGLRRKLFTDSESIKMEDGWILAFSEQAPP